MEDLKFKPLGISGHPQAFFDNRAHGCYAGFYGEEEYSVASSVLIAVSPTTTPSNLATLALFVMNRSSV